MDLEKLFSDFVATLDSMTKEDLDESLRNAILDSANSHTLDDYEEDQLISYSETSATQSLSVKYPSLTISFQDDAVSEGEGYSETWEGVDAA